MHIHLLSGIALLTALAAAPALASETAQPFVASRDAATFDRALECLTQAVYYEARSESEGGQRAVAQVVLNRVRHPAYPNSVCGVVYQGAQRSTGCQFSFTCDGSMDAAIEPYAWDRARGIAAAALGGAVYRPVGLATNYHTTAIRPYWAPSLVQQATLGAHIFYRRPGSAGTLDAFVQTPAEDEPEAGLQPRYASPGIEAPRRSRPRRMGNRPVLLVEIPVVERPVVFRTVGERPRSGAGRSQTRASTAAERRTPRVTVQNGVRIARGS